MARRSAVLRRLSVAPVVAAALGLAAPAALEAGPRGTAVGEPAASAPAVVADTTEARTAGAPVDDASDSPLRLRLMALGGVSGLTADGTHPYGGLELGFLYDRLGVMGLGQYGSGNDFSSLLLAAGPAIELYDAEFASFTLYAGGGWYREKLDAGFDRDMAALYGGLAVRVPLRMGAVGMTVSLWQGKLDGPGIDFPTTLRAHRFSFGLGL